MKREREGENGDGGRVSSSTHEMGIFDEIINQVNIAFE